jgi:c-di-GMP-binding flagellar brake protein YcgR
MSEEHIETVATTQGQTRVVTDPAEISRILGELVERKELLFFSEIGAGRSFLANGIGVDAQRRTLRIAVAKESGAGIQAGSEFDVFAPIRHADLVFAVAVLHPVSGQENTYDLDLPPRLRLWHRREHPRGSCFGLVDVIVRRKDKPQNDDLKANLRDISNAGLGIALPQGMEQSVHAGDTFDDCVLLINDKPMAACAIEVLHAQREPETGNLLAGGRFVNLDAVAKERIRKLIAVLDPLWGEPPRASGD